MHVYNANFLKTLIIFLSLYSLVSYPAPTVKEKFKSAERAAKIAANPEKANEAEQFVNALKADVANRSNISLPGEIYIFTKRSNSYFDYINVKHDENISYVKYNENESLEDTSLSQKWDYWGEQYGDDWEFMGFNETTTPEGEIIFLQYEGDELIGCLNLNDSGEILAIIVDKSKEGKGLATSLINYATYDLTHNEGRQLLYADDLRSASMRNILVKNGYEPFNAEYKAEGYSEITYLGSDTSVDFTGVYIKKPLNDTASKHVLQLANRDCN